MKRVLFIFSCLILGLWSVNATQYSGNCNNGVTWTLDTEDSVLVVSGAGELTAGMQNYLYASYVRTVHLPEGLTAIGKLALANMPNLTSVQLPSTLTSIGQQAFFYCTSLTSISLPDGLLSLGAGAFQDCTHLLSLTIPAGVTSIPQGAFYGCARMTSLTLPDGITAIPANACQDCKALTSIHIPDSVTSIGERAFAGCIGLDTLRLPETLTMIGASAFALDSSVTDIFCHAMVPPTVDATAFDSMATDLRLHVPADAMPLYAESAVWATMAVQAIDEEPLDDGLYHGICGEHLTWTYNPETEDMIIEGYGVLSNTVDSLWWNKTVIKPSSWATGYKTYYPYNSCKRVILPEGLTGFCKEAFRDFTSMTECIVPEGVKVIPDATFYGCTALKSMHLPNSVDTIGNNAFYGCKAMTAIHCGEGVKHIGNYAFFDCLSIRSVRWSDSLETIGTMILDAMGDDYSSGTVYLPLSDTLFFPAPFRSNNQLSWCQMNRHVIVWNARKLSTQKQGYGGVLYNPYHSYREVLFGPDVEEVPDFFLWGQTGVEDITLPEGVTKVGTSAFSGCRGIRTVSLPSTLVALQQSAFQNCSNLGEVVLPDHLTNVSANVFSGCTALRRVTIPASVTTIGDGAFSGCTTLDSVLLPEAVTMIGGSAFSGVKTPSSLVIPNKVISVGANAFENWSSLTDLTIGKNVVLLADNVFAGDSAITRIQCLAANPPMVSQNTLADIPDSAVLYVIPDSRTLYEQHPYWSRFRLENLPDSAYVVGEVVVEPSVTTADFTWPTDVNASVYTLDIYRDGMVFCRLTLGPTGQLLAIAFASPAMRQAGAVPAMLGFKVTGLTAATRYNYVLAALDANETPLHVYIGAFATVGYEGQIDVGGAEVIPTPPVVPYNPEYEHWVPTALPTQSAEHEPMGKTFHNGLWLIRSPHGVFDINGRPVSK